MNNYIEEKDGIFPSVCSLDCPDQCGLLVHKKDGKIVKIEGDPDHPVTQGNICNKVRNMAERIYDPKRLQYPLKRVGAKGEGKFERISWEEAIETVRLRWTDLIENEGPESILPYSFYGNMGKLCSEGLDRRFFHRLGTSQLDRTICSAAGSTGYKYTMGGSFGTDPEETIDTNMFIFWGVNAVSTNMHQVAIAEKARKKHGAKIVVIDVHKNQTGRWADWFIPILPGTDSALALGLMHILFAENLVDNSFLEKYTVGHEDLREHVEQYDPVLVSEITGVPVEDIYKLARMYGKVSPSFIRIGNGMQHHDNGGMCIRTVSCLPALTGQWLVRGGGAIKGNGSFLDHNYDALERPDLLEKQTRTINMNLIGKALLEEDKPIRSMFVYNCNPALVAPEGNKVREGLERDDLFLVVHDLFLTETAMYADIVLPATSSFENIDFFASYWHYYMQIQKPVISAYGESKSNTEVFRLLSGAMGLEEDCLYDSDEELIRQALDNPENPYLEGITFESLCEKQYVKAASYPIMEKDLKTPSGKIELYSEALASIGLPALPTYTPIVEDGEHPFIFIPAPNHNFLNSTFSNNEKHISLEKVARLHINRTDAQSLNIENGDKIRVWNDRGECELFAAVGENVLPGVVVTQGIWADLPDTKYFVNSLTPDRVADMGGGATFFSGRVNVEKV